MQQYQPPQQHPSQQPNNPPAEATLPHGYVPPAFAAPTVKSGQAPPAHPASQGAPPPIRRAMPRPRARKNSGGLLYWIIGIMGFLSLLTVILFAGLLLYFYTGNDILPGVTTAGVDIGGMSQNKAARTIETTWQERGILIRDEERVWSILPSELGLRVDGAATAERAYEWGRGEKPLIGLFEGFISGAEIRPHLRVDLPIARARLEELRPVLEQPARNAGIALVNGEVQAQAPITGRALNLEATLNRLQTNAAAEFTDGALDLVMIPISPSVTDATPLLNEARALLGAPLVIELYDPISDEHLPQTLPPQEWGRWLVAASDSASPLGLSLSLDPASLSAYLSSLGESLGGGRKLDVEASTEQINARLAERNLTTQIRVYHEPTVYTVRGGETLSSIGYNLGIPYPWIQAANPGLGALNPGQQINIPSKDDLLPLPIIPNKRIVVSIPQQRLLAYENGGLKWEWSISTGIARSPTAPGVFQIQSHDVNAYAAQWNLYMPHFMGVYEPGPNAGVMNGFHGFPTDARGGYLLWTNNLGRPATYGCILLSLENAKLLYDWAEDGVVVEITG